jgi:hypothetical protein
MPNLHIASEGTRHVGPGEGAEFGIFFCWGSYSTELHLHGQNAAAGGEGDGLRAAGGAELAE